MKRAEDTIKHLDASIAAQEATNEKRLAELAQTRNNYQSEVEVTELYFRNVVSEIQFHYSLRNEISEANEDRDCQGDGASTVPHA